MNTTMNMTFLQEVGTALVTIAVTATSTTISFIFSLISALISAALFQNGVNTTSLFGS